MLGPYEVVSLLGAGGMGEVYRARDTRLDRVVAVKVLRSGIGDNGELRMRFEREARAISHLSHPHICALYDVGNHNGSEYLVMEYVEGETLAERIQRGPLAVSQVLRYGTQIAEALHHAHRGGITHRDLKPGNVMLTTTGAKLLDFGLAKFAERLQHSSDDSAPETLKHLTAEGTIVGTFQYMSPEQIQGNAVDPRSDIFSLGIVLYEMTSGQRPFPATTSTALIAAILSADPVPLRSLQPATPPALERIVQTALEKNPDERWQTAQDVGRQLRWLAQSSPALEPSAMATSRPRRSRAVALIALIAVAARSSPGVPEVLRTDHRPLTLRSFAVRASPRDVCHPFRRIAELRAVARRENALFCRVSGNRISAVSPGARLARGPKIGTNGWCSGSFLVARRRVDWLQRRR